MKVNACALILLAALSASMSLPAIPASKMAGKVVKMGVLTDLAGVYSDVFGPKHVKIAQLAVADFIEKEKPDFKVELVSADHQNKPELAVQQAREWFDKDGVTMIAECSVSPCALAVNKLIAQRKKVMFVEGASSTALTNEECTPYTVQYTGDTDAVSAGTVIPIVQQGGKSWYLLAVDTALGTSLEKSLRREITAQGGKIVGFAKHPLGTADFSSYMLRAQSSHADVVAVLSNGSDLKNAVATADEFGLVKQQMIVPIILDLSNTRSLGLPVIKGTLHTESFYWDLNDETRAFTKHCQSAIKVIPGERNALIYSAITNYLKAVKALDTDDADAVMKYLKSNKINDFMSKNAFIRMDGKLIHDRFLLQGKKPSESKYDGDYYKLLKVIPGTATVPPLSQSKCPFCEGHL